MYNPLIRLFQHISLDIQRLPHFSTARFIILYRYSVYCTLNNVLTSILRHLQLQLLVNVFNFFLQPSKTQATYNNKDILLKFIWKPFLTPHENSELQHSQQIFFLDLKDLFCVQLNFPKVHFMFICQKGVV